jgi:type IV pilus assembly protein PilM
MKSFVGVDIGSDAVKLVELKKTRKGLVLKRAGYLPYHEIPLAEGTSKEDIAVEAIRWILAQNKIKQAVACVALPPEDVYTKYIKLPPVSADKVDQIVQFEARQQIPFPLEEVAWDYHLLGSDQKSGQAHIVLNAVKEASVYSFMNHMDDSGIKVKIIDTSSMALYNMLALEEANMGSLILDIGKESTQVLLMDEQTCWSRILPIGGAYVTQKLSEKANISMEEAEQFKKDIGLQGEGLDGKRSQILEESLEDLIAEVQKSLDYYTHLSEDFAVKKIYLTGGQVRLRGLIDFFAEKMAKDVEGFNPFGHVQIDGMVGEERSHEMRHFFAVAMGLALRHVGVSVTQMNLMPLRLLQDQKAKRMQVVVTASGILLAAFFVLHGVKCYEDLSAMEQEMHIAQREIQVFRVMEQEIQSLKKDIAPMELQLKIFEELSEMRTKSLDILLSLKKMTINDMLYPFLQMGFSEDELQKVEALLEGHLDERERRKRRQKSDRRTYIAQRDELLLQGVTSDSYRKIDNLKISLESFPSVKGVIVEIAEAHLNENRKKIIFNMRVKLVD